MNLAYLAKFSYLAGLTGPEEEDQEAPEERLQERCWGLS